MSLIGNENSLRNAINNADNTGDAFKSKKNEGRREGKVSSR